MMRRVSPFFKNRAACKARPFCSNYAIGRSLRPFGTAIATTGSPSRARIMNEFETFQTHESAVNYYGQTNKAMFAAANGSTLLDTRGNKYIDFFAGAGSLNYGHNHPVLLEAHLDFMKSGALVQGLDFYTPEREDFLQNLYQLILKPRDLMDYKVQFCGPTGTNAVESALKLARLVTGRETVVHFTNSYHGVTIGSLAISGNASKKRSMLNPSFGAMCLSYDGYTDCINSIDILRDFEAKLTDPSSGVMKPAAIILECVQGEGGLNVASVEWLQEVARICSEHDILFIVDEIQAGVGRTGKFFAFEWANTIKPDIITISKSFSGNGSPLAVNVFKKELDAWNPGEHNGTFRGYNPAFATASAAMNFFWRDNKFEQQIMEKASIVQQRLNHIVSVQKGTLGECKVKGKGLMIGLSFQNPSFGEVIKNECFANGLLLETCGPFDEVVKLFPALTISNKELTQGLDVLEHVIETHATT